MTASLWAQAQPGNLWGPTQTFGWAPRPISPFVMGGLSWSCKIQNDSPAGDVSVVKFHDLTINGAAIDTSEASSGVLGPGGFNTGPGTGGPLSAASPFFIKYDLDIPKFGGASTHARITDNWLTSVQLHSDGSQKTPQQTDIALPTDNTVVYTVPITSWETHKKTMFTAGEEKIPFILDVTPAWAASQDPPWESADLAVPLWINPARSDPSAGGATYNGVVAHFTVGHTARDLEFPNGARRSHWVAADPMLDSVTEHAGRTDLTNGGGSGQFSRTFVQSWRTWTASPFVHGIDAYEITKHDYFGAGDDLWGWESYPEIQYDIDAPVAGDVTLQVDLVHLEVNDSHATGTRASDYSQTEHGASYQYTIHLEPGPNTGFIDLLFPTGGGPKYYGRVDKLTLSGLQVGTYTIQSLVLIGIADLYLKHDIGPPRVRDDYSVLHASNEGALCHRAWPDELYKPDEVGAHPPYGGGLRYVDVITNSITGDVNDATYSLATMIGHWIRMEGWDCSYDGSAYLAANGDPFGTMLGPDLSFWLRPIAPHLRVPIDTDVPLPCGPLVRRLYITNARVFTIYTRHNAFGCIESQAAKADGSREGPGVQVDVIRTDTGATVQSGLTDADGFATISPIPANGSRVYDVAHP